MQHCNNGVFAVIFMALTGKQLHVERQCSSIFVGSFICSVSLNLGWIASVS